MQNSGFSPSLPRKPMRLAILITVVAVCILLFKNILSELTILLLGAAAVAFLLSPLAVFFEKRLSRSLSALAALVSVLCLLLLAVWLLLPALIGQLSQLTRSLPEAIMTIKDYTFNLTAWIESRLPGISLPNIAIPKENLPKLAAATFDMAGGFAGSVYKLSLMIVLGYFFLTDRERLLLRLELLIPSSMRKTAVRMGNAVCRELKLYLRGQGMISLAVGGLSAAGLAVVGVPSPLVLGLIVGILNMIPYFGPILGGIPAVLAAFTCGWQTALAAAFVLWLVQQLDSTFISPRILGGITGLSPAIVLLAIFVGSRLNGVVGMLIALPLLMTFRTVFRVFVQRHENV